MTPATPDTEELIERTAAGEAGATDQLMERHRDRLRRMVAARLDRRVALKVLPFAAALDSQQLRRFKTEAQAAAQLDHTHIVPVHSVGCERGVHYYAMQFIEGQTLAQAIADRRSAEEPPRREPPDPSPPRGEGGPKVADPPKEEPMRGRGEGGPEVADPPKEERMRGDADQAPGGSLLSSPLVGEGGPEGRMGGQADHPNPDPPPSRGRDDAGDNQPARSATPTPSSRTGQYCRAAAALGIQAAEALDHAHKVGIIHRDIKPANLLLDVQGNIWITDFGLARLHDDAGLTITGDVLGTLRYMSPEQALAKRGYLDHRTDIYSLGATLYELVTLRPAVAGQDRQEVLRKIAQDEPAPPHSLNTAIPRELETIILKAMSKEAESRYATAQELADDLRRFLEDKPIKARRPTLLERAARWSRRHATAVGATALVLLVAAVGLAVSTAIIARRNAEIRRKNEQIVQQANQIKTALDQSEEAREQAEAVSRFLVDAFRRPDPEQDGRELKVVDLLSSAAEKLDTDFAASPLIKGELLNALGVTLNDLGSHKKAAELHEKARAVRTEMLGADHPQTLTSCNNLAEAYLDAGGAQALPLFEATLKLRESKLGPQHADTLESRNNVALARAMAGPTLYAQYGPASSFLTVLNQNGQATSLPSTDPNGPGTDNWEVEEALDVEWAHAIAPGAQIILVEANSQSLSDLMAAVGTAAHQPDVSVVSMSWGFAEGQAVFAADEAAYDAVFNVPGVTFVASTGDYGAADPEYPDFSPNVVAVGGTSLTLNADNSYNSETGWGYYSNAVGAFIASGGEVSLYEPEPAYQQGVQSTGSRTTPDVSFVADPATGAWIADTYNLDPSNPFEVVGGTSLSAPAWAGLLALVDQGRAAAGESALNSSSPTEVQQALYSLPQSDYNAITSGSNGYTASAGYNLVTGLGTPVANLLVPDLIAYHGAATSYTGPTVAPLQSSGLVNTGTSDSGPMDVFSVFDSITVTQAGLNHARGATALHSAVERGPAGELAAPATTMSAAVDQIVSVMVDETSHETLIGDLAFEQVSSGTHKASRGWSFFSGNPRGFDGPQATEFGFSTTQHTQDTKGEDSGEQLRDCPPFRVRRCLPWFKNLLKTREQKSSRQSCKSASGGADFQQPRSTPRRTEE